MYHITKPIKEFILNHSYLIENIYGHLIDAKNPVNYNNIMAHLNDPINFKENELSQIRPYIIYIYIKQPKIHTIVLNKCIDIFFYPYSNRIIYSKEENHIVNRILNYDNKLLTIKRAIQIYFNSCKNGELGILQQIFHYIYLHIKNDNNYRYELYILKLLGLSITNYKHIIDWLNTQCLNKQHEIIFINYYLLDDILSKFASILTKEDIIFICDNNIKKINITSCCVCIRPIRYVCETAYIYKDCIFIYNTLYIILCDIHLINKTEAKINNNNIVYIYNKIKNLILNKKYIEIKNIYNIYDDENKSDKLDIINKWLLLGYFMDLTKERIYIDWFIKKRIQYTNIISDANPIDIYNQMQYHKQLFIEDKTEYIAEEIKLNEIKWICRHCTFENTNIENAICLICELRN
jgi:hypothetical protein